MAAPQRLTSIRGSSSAGRWWTKCGTPTVRNSPGKIRRLPSPVVEQGVRVVEKTGDPDKDKPGLTYTNDDGDFDFDLTDTDRWPDGDYLLTIFHPATSISFGQKKITKETNKELESVWVKVPDKELSHKTGVTFFTILALCWLGLAGGYL